MSAGITRRAPSRPRIGITVHSAAVMAREGNEEVRFEVAARYAEAVALAGGTPLLLPAHPGSALDTTEIVAALDGLLLSGGGGLSAQYFDANPNPSLRDTNPPRYDVEIALVRTAAAAGLPLMGICRGHQTIAEALGGALLADLRRVDGNAEHYQNAPAYEPTHALRTAPGSLLGRYFPTGTRVNSFHRQVVSAVPRGWAATSWSDEGLIETMEAEVGFGLGCQFHPEWLGGTEPGFSRLFEEFVAAARGFAR